MQNQPMFSWRLKCSSSCYSCEQLRIAIAIQWNLHALFRTVYFICKCYSFNSTTAQEIDSANYKRHMNRRDLLAPTCFCIYYFRFMAWLIVDTMGFIKLSCRLKEKITPYTTIPPTGLWLTSTVLVPRYIGHHLWIIKVDLVLGQTSQTNMNMITQPTLSSFLVCTSFLGMLLT